MADESAKVTKIPVSLTADVMAIVDAEAKRLQRHGMRPNRSEAIRVLILEAAAGRSKSLGKKSGKKSG